MAVSEEIGDRASVGGSGVVRRWVDALVMFLVSAVSLLLLVYVGFGEGQQTYRQFQVEKVTTQGRIVQEAMSGFLRGGGLSVRQFVGFKPLTESLLESDSTIAAMVVFDRKDQTVFASGNTRIPLLPPDSIAEARSGAGYEIRQTNDYIQVLLPLRNKFETVGKLAVTMPRSVIRTRVEDSFGVLPFIAVGLSIAFAWFASKWGARLSRRRFPWVQAAYAVIFLAMSAIVIGTLVRIYSEGAQANAKALADSLGMRVSDIVAFNLNIEEFDGLERTFGDYRRVNPDISAAGLTVNGRVVIHTDPAAVGRPWVSDRRIYDYVFDVSRPENARRVQVAVALPVKIVWDNVARSVKNFAALFVASAFLAGVFLQFGHSARSAPHAGAAGEDEPGEWRGERALAFVKPVFFVGVFLEHLTYSFLPQFMQRGAIESGLPADWASAPFTVYYLFFALTLIPAGHLTRLFGARSIIYIGLAIAGVGVIALSLPLDFWLVMAARAAGGIGQGMLFIGVQSYILATAAPNKKTQGAGIIVYGFQGGMISGTAVGSLLVIHIGAQGVFFLAGSIALVTALYTRALVPKAPQLAPAGEGIVGSLGNLGRDLALVVRNLDFLRTMFLIGIPAKAVMTGIVIFALPLLLAQRQFAQEDIGQIIMLYAAGVLVANSMMARIVDRTGKTEYILFWGAMISGAGLFFLGAIDWPPIRDLPMTPSLTNIVLVVGVLALGLAHGFINAPVVTHVAESELARRIGEGTTTAAYRFLERLGHVAGPIIVGQLLISSGQSSEAFIWVAAAVTVFGILFILRGRTAESVGLRRAHDGDAS